MQKAWSRPSATCDSWPRSAASASQRLRPARQDRSGLDLFKIAERYRALLELGDQAGVVPQVEVWGFSKTLGKLSETALVAVESEHPKACILPDVYHLYKGGSDFEGLRLLSGDAVQVIHMNDYPADPPRDKIADKDRVYPGDGVAPLTQILRDMHAAGFRGYLSLELFNASYWRPGRANGRAHRPRQDARSGATRVCLDSRHL